MTSQCDQLNFNYSALGYVSNPYLLGYLLYNLYDKKTIHYTLALFFLSFSSHPRHIPYGDVLGLEERKKKILFFKDIVK